ncbi:hypothetical protein BYZ73_00105 [Rhodovulum viride]|uniref:4Fe-4S ferredoxin-type domain-containing protein n=2 Tax=Rhodovulum viride TaxID=1231134 RepID=A0ABX9DN48_9RHOB|nr:hypothetical protein BYZ73_00105 [Rhodovulum viride]
MRLVDLADPDALSETLDAHRPPPRAPAPVRPHGGRREAARLAARVLAGPERRAGPPIPLPKGAPHGAVRLDPEAWALCLSRAGLCPSGALGDTPDRSELRVREEACLHCGICATVCPEEAIALVPQLDRPDAALSLRVLKAEDPYACIECGAPFGVKTTVGRIAAQPAGRQPMVSGSDKARPIRMGDRCRVRVQFDVPCAPFRMGARPRTAADYPRDPED